MTSVVFNKTDISKGLARVGLFKVKNPVLPIIENVVVSVNKNSCTLKVTNLQTSIIQNVPCKSKSKFELCLEYDKLKSFVSNSKDDITIEYEDQIAVISDAASDFKMSVDDVSAFPEMAKVSESATEVNLDTASFVDALTCAKNLVSTDELRLAMCGINIDAQDDVMYITGTNAHVLYHGKLDPIGEAINVIVSPSIQPLLAGVTDENLVVNIDDTNIRVKGEDFVLISRLIDAKYPQVSAVIPDPESYVTSIKVPTAELKSAVSKLGSCISTQNFVLCLHNSFLALYGDEEIGNSMMEIVSEVELIDGSEMFIAIAFDKVDKALRSITDSHVVLNYIAENKALVMNNADSDAATILCMPIMMTMDKDAIIGKIDDTVNKLF